MDKRPIALAVALSMATSVLSGCGGAVEQNSDPNHGYGFEYNLESEDGTRVRYNNPITQAEFELYFAEPYRATERCAEILTGGPLVVVVPKDSLLPSVGKTYIQSDLLILIDESWEHDSRVMMHESVHYLLAISGFPMDQNRNHESPLFVKCAGF